MRILNWSNAYYHSVSDSKGEVSAEENILTEKG
jgi:hypothetical protein